MLAYLRNLLINSLNHSVPHYNELLGQMKTLQQTEEITVFVLFCFVFTKPLNRNREQRIINKVYLNTETEYKSI